MAIVRDLFGGLSLVRMVSRLSLVSGLAPILAPVIGSQLLFIMPWRGMFVVLAVYGAVALLASLFFIVETLPPARRIDLGHSTTRERYRALFTDRVFVGVAIIAGLTFSGLFAYLSSSSFLFQTSTASIRRSSACSSPSTRSASSRECRRVPSSRGSSDRSGS